MESTQPVQDFAFRRVGRGRPGRDLAHATPGLLENRRSGPPSPTATIVREQDARCRRAGFLPLNRNCLMQWRQPKLPRSWAFTIRDTGSGSVDPFVPKRMTDFLESLDQISRTLSSWN